jgi:peptide/nickel transport system substrate-binding protein
VQTRSRGRRVAAVVIVVATLGVTVACGQGTRTSDGDAIARTDASDDTNLPPESGGHLVYGIETDPNGLDPTRNAFDPVGIQLANALYDPLAAFDSRGTPQPYLAQSIEAVPGTDFTAWRVTLRSGVVFQSGRPLDATAVKSYIDAVTGEYIDKATKTKRPSITQDAARFIASIEVVSPLEVLIRMHRPWATFPALLTGQGGYVISAEQIDNPEGHSAPDGTGPFRLSQWKPGARLELVRNPTYWRAGLPYLDSVDFEVKEDGDARVSALQRGSIDVLSAGTGEQVRRIDELVRKQRERGDASTIRVERDPGASEDVFIMLNTAKKPLDSELVRQALAYATDVEALARDNGWDRDRIITGPFASSSPWFAPTDMPRYDLSKARSLVAEYKHEQNVTDISFDVVGISQPLLMAQLRDQWAQAGIHVRLSMTDFRRSVPLAVGGNYDAIQYRYFSAVDPDSLYHFWVSETSRPIGQISLNFTRFGNEAIDTAMARARSTTDVGVRQDSYAVVQRELARHVPYIWLFRSEWVVARTPRVHNARNVTLPDGSAALPFDTGTHRLTETWVSSRG